MAGALQRSDRPIALITTSALATTYLTFGFDPGAVDLTVISTTPLAVFHAESAHGVDQCVANYEESSGNTVNVGVVDPDPDNFLEALRACRGIDLFTKIATAAGPDLTNESFTAAAEQLAQLELVGSSAASLAPGKTGADDTPMVMLGWDAELQDFRPT